MTYDTIITEIADNCRRQVSETGQKTFIRRQINLAQQEMQRFQPIWWLETTLSQSLGSPGATGTAYYDLPSNFDFMDWRTMHSSTRQLLYVGIDWVDINDPDYSENGEPSRFGVIGKQFFFHPRVSASYALTGTVAARYFKDMLAMNTTGTATGGGVDYGDSDTPDAPLVWQEGILLGGQYRVLKFLGVPRWDTVRTEFRALMRELSGRGPTVGGPGQISDGGMSYIIGKNV